MKTFPRSGSVLIVIAGLLAMLATLSLAFLMRMRQDAQESDLVIHLAQCRLMLHGGMQFIQESSRLGYATKANPSVEAWGWIDTRDGSIGPKDNNRVKLWTAGTWPAPGTVKRAPMFVVRRPPFAVVPHMYPNPIPDVTDPAVDPNYQNHFGIPVLKKPDPTPAFDPALGAHDPTNAAQRLSWENGDLQPLDSSLGLAWFRIYRENGTEPLSERPASVGPVGATFIITVGSGGTQGFKDWPEVVAAGAQSEFGNSSAIFSRLLAAELRQWFRVEWSAAVGGSELRAYMQLDDTPGGGNWTGGYGNSWQSSKVKRWHARTPLNASRSQDKGDGEETYSSTEARNYVGTIDYIQRLESSPTTW